MNLMLSASEIRVLGSLIEKEITTPDYYPLTLNSLTNACNQKSNRDPVMNLDEKTVLRTLEGLFQKKLVWQKNLAGCRTVKYAHRIDSLANFSAQELGALCILFLRGPQTAGEIRSRTTRLCEFNDVPDVEKTLQRLLDLEGGPYVIKLPRSVGRRESRYAHLFCGEINIDQEEPIPLSEEANFEASTKKKHLIDFETEIVSLRKELNELKDRFDKFIREFE